MKRALLWFSALFPVLGIVACDPCSGVASCGVTDDEFVRYEGEVVRRFTGDPAPGVRVGFVRTAGVRSERDSAFTVSDSLGRFVLDLGTAPKGEVIGQIVLQAEAPFQLQRIEQVRLQTTPSSAQRRYLGTFRVNHPYFFAYGELVRRATGTPLAGVEVEFRRVGGIRVQPNTYYDTTDFSGRFALEPHPLEPGEVIFDLVVRPPAPYRPFTISERRMSTLDREIPEKRRILRAGVGPHLPYFAEFFYAGTNRPVQFAPVEVRRVGGPPLERESYTTRTNAGGQFDLGPVPLGYGEVIFSVTVQPTDTRFRPFTVPALRVQTTEADVTAPSSAGRFEVPAS